MIISGGQTGVDRAALDFAIESGLPYGGWVPQGGRALDFPEPPGLLAVYPELREHPSRDWAPRTMANIKNSNATLIVIKPSAQIGHGTQLTIRSAEQLHKPLLMLHVDDPDAPDAPDALATARRFFAQFEDAIALNVAGSREAFPPFVYDETINMLRIILAEFLLV